MIFPKKGSKFENVTLTKIHEVIFDKPITLSIGDVLHISYTVDYNGIKCDIIDEPIIVEAK